MKHIRIIIILLTVFLLTGCVGEVKINSPASMIESSTSSIELMSNRFTRPESVGKKEEGFVLDGFEAIMENKNYAVYFRKEVCTIRLLDKKSGYVWGCLASDKPVDLNKKWAKFANSIVTADVYSEEGELISLGADNDDLTLTISGDILKGKIYWEEYKIGFNFSMKLTLNGLTFAIEDDSIVEADSYVLGEVSFIPFWGSTVEDERQGYIFVPDGCGALIRFNKSRDYINDFSKKIYGNDLGIDSTAVLNDLNADRINAFASDEETVSIPVFGVTHGVRQNAVMAVIDKGDNYAIINAVPAGIITDYNRVCAKFIYRQKYEQPVSKKGAGVHMVQGLKNKVNPEISYYFLTDENADYVGMAKMYQEILESQGKLNRTEKDRNSASGIPVKLDFLSADIESGFLGSSTRKITEIDVITEMEEYFSNKNIKNLRISLLGWQPGGLNGYDKSYRSAKTVYGNSRLPDGIGFYLNPFSAKEGQLSMGSESAITLSQKVMLKEGEDQAIYLGDNYYLKPDKGSEYLKAQIKVLVDKGYSNFMFDDIGYLLYGEYPEKNIITRYEVRTLIEQTADELAELIGGKLSIVRPNSYLYKQTGEYLNMPLVSSQFIYETDTVPFLQIVLSGYMDIYAAYTNFSFYSRTDILKQIDYNTYPSFLLTGENNYELRKTASAHIRSSYVYDWQDYIENAYEMMNDVMVNTMGQKIVGREVLETGLVKVDYETGSVYVNYNSAEKEVAGIIIPAESAVYR